MGGGFLVDLACCRHAWNKFQFMWSEPNSGYVLMPMGLHLHHQYSVACGMNAWNQKMKILGPMLDHRQLPRFAALLGEGKFYLICRGIYLFTSRRFFVVLMGIALLCEGPSVTVWPNLALSSCVYTCTRVICMETNKTMQQGQFAPQHTFTINLSVA
uniref:Uncharacterized protein n=1 Tax=Oryza brachyantha TaxID=4533 RepID=J3LEJ6_ORYBR